MEFNRTKAFTIETNLKRVLKENKASIEKK